MGSRVPCKQSLFLCVIRVFNMDQGLCSTAALGEFYHALRFFMLKRHSSHHVQYVDTSFFSLMPNNVFSWNWCFSKKSPSFRRGDCAESGLVSTVFPSSQKADQEPSQNRARVAAGLGLVGVVDLVTMIALFKSLSSKDTRNKRWSSAVSLFLIWNSYAGHRTRTLIQKLIMWIVTRCMLVTLNQIALLVVFVVRPASYIWYEFSDFYATILRTVVFLGCHFSCSTRNSMSSP
jgi:hypothetical protein